MKYKVINTGHLIVKAHPGNNSCCCIFLTDKHAAVQIIGDVSVIVTCNYNYSKLTDSKFILLPPASRSLPPPVSTSLPNLSYLHWQPPRCLPPHGQMR